MNLVPPMVNISTYQNSATNFPYMFAIAPYQNLFYSANNSADAYYVQVEGALSLGDNRTKNITPIGLEKCTTQHFSVIPDI